MTIQYQTHTSTLSHVISSMDIPSFIIGHDLVNYLWLQHALDRHADDHGKALQFLRDLSDDLVRWDLVSDEFGYRMAEVEFCGRNGSQGFRVTMRRPGEWHVESKVMRTVTVNVGGKIWGQI